MPKLLVCASANSLFASSQCLRRQLAQAALLLSLGAAFRRFAAAVHPALPRCAAAAADVCDAPLSPPSGLA